MANMRPIYCEKKGSNRNKENKGFNSIKIMQFNNKGGRGTGLKLRISIGSLYSTGQLTGTD